MSDIEESRVSKRESKSAGKSIQVCKVTKYLLSNSTKNIGQYFIGDVSFWLGVGCHVIVGRKPSLVTQDIKVCEVTVEERV